MDNNINLEISRMTENSLQSLYFNYEFLYGGNRKRLISFNIDIEIMYCYYVDYKYFSSIE